LIAPAQFFDGRTAAAHAVEATICGSVLQVRTPDGVVIASWPIASLVRTALDAPGEQVTLRMGRGPECLVLLNRALLGDLEAGGAKIGGLRQRWGRHAWLGATAGVVACIAAVVLLVDQLPALAVGLVPPAVERLWSTSIEAAISVGSRRCEAPVGRQALSRLMGTLAQAAGLSSPPPVVVLDSPVVNAFTLPDGRIVVMRGLIAMVGNGDELAGVMAHELGHMLHHDPTREMIRRRELGAVASLLGNGGSIASQMTALSYGRQAEAAADASALDTLRRAGLATDGLGHFLARIQSGPGGTELPAFLSDHPSTAARIAALNVVSTGAPAMTTGDWASIQTICSAITPD